MESGTQQRRCHAGSAIFVSQLRVRPSILKKSIQQPRPQCGVTIGWEAGGLMEGSCHGSGRIGEAH
jgi:hypothetical protein